MRCLFVVTFRSKGIVMEFINLLTFYVFSCQVAIDGIQGFPPPIKLTAIVLGKTVCLEFEVWRQTSWQRLVAMVYLNPWSILHSVS